MSQYVRQPPVPLRQTHEPACFCHTSATSRLAVDTMRALRRRLAPAVVAILVTVISGCSGFGTIADRTGTTTAEGPGERWHRALQLLGRGEERQAEALFGELRDAPGYGERARHMLDQIRRPIHRYFPTDHFNVRLRAGQSLSALSRHYLDDPLKFFALARYNGIAAPNRVAAGQLIRIPLTDHARRVRTAEMGSPEVDDPIDESAMDDSPMEDSPGSADEADSGSTGTDSGNDHKPNHATALSDAERERVRRYYREATIAFQQQDLERTVRYCERVLKLDPDHENCLGYRDRAHALQRQLDRIQKKEETNGD